MAKLRNARMEKFCQFMAREGCDPSEACFKAGYGVDAHPRCDSYHAMQGSRLMCRKDVVFRIQEIRDGVCIEEKDKRETMIERLYKIINYNPAKYMQVYQTCLENGRTVQDTIIKKEFTDFTKWDEDDLAMIDHFDSRTGNPVFLDKKWAFEKLLKILQLDGSDRGVDIQDILSLFTSAGLRLGKPEDVQAMLQESDESTDKDDDFDDLDDDFEGDE